jgi:integrase
MKSHNGSGTIYQRGNTWWVKIHVDGRPIYRSSKSSKYADAVKLRDQLIAKKVRGELTGGAPDKVLIGELLDDVLKSDIEESTRYIWQKVVEKNIRPFFGKIRAAALTTDKMDAYRKKRIKEGRADSTVNRELSVLRTAFHNGRKRTPPKVITVPYFPMVKETNVRQGFLSDEQYAALRDALPPELQPLFVCDYLTGIRKGELLAITWDQVDFEQEVIYLPADTTKGKEGRNVPIVAGDMERLLRAAKQERDKHWPKSPWVFNRQGQRLKDFRDSWDSAVEQAAIETQDGRKLTIHDLRRTAVRNMRRAGVPQVIRMSISGHKTGDMERRYNIADDEDILIAKKVMGERMKGFSLQSNQGGGGDGEIVTVTPSKLKEFNK